MHGVVVLLLVMSVVVVVVVVLVMIPSLWLGWVELLMMMMMIVDSLHRPSMVELLMVVMVPRRGRGRKVGSSVLCRRPAGLVRRVPARRHVVWPGIPLVVTSLVSIN